MPQSVIQSSFASGEVSPTLFGRVDLAKYRVGLQKCTNAFVDYRGGVSSRAGTEFVGECFDSQAVILKEFQFSTLQTYVLEFGNFYMRVIKDGGLVLEPTRTITVMDIGSDPILTAVAHGYGLGDRVYVEGTGSLPDGFYFVAQVVDVNHVRLHNMADQIVNAVGATTGTGTIARIYKLNTPYSASDVATLRFTQSADTLTVVHPDHTPKNITRTAHDNWSITEVNFNPSIGVPTNLGFTQSSGGSTFYNYAVTAVDDQGNESVASTALHVENTVNMSATAGSITLTWDPVTGAASYNIYRTTPSFVALPSTTTLAYVGRSVAGVQTFVDTNITPDFSKSPPTHTNPFSSVGNYPSVVTYYQQRKVYAATRNGPNKFWMSQPVSFNNFDKSIPSRDDNSIEGTLASQQVNHIKSLTSMPSGLIALTSGSAWLIGGGTPEAAVTPKTVMAKPQVFNGVGNLPPIIVNYDLLYVQALNSAVRDLSYNFYANVYTGVDLTILSNHLFYGHQIVSWAYTEEPYKIIWCIREDGTMLSLTFLKEQDIYGWAYHQTNGAFESVVAIPEGDEFHAYFIVRRDIPGRGLIRYIERMASRGSSTDAHCVDCGFSYDGSPTAFINNLAPLEGMLVSILADGVPQPRQTVTDGKITLDAPASKIKIGLGYSIQGQTLRLESPGEGTVQGKRKDITAVTMRVDNTPIAPRIGREFNDATMYYPKDYPASGSGDFRENTGSDWETTGVICWQHDEPTPITVLAVVPEISVGDSSR